MLRLHEAANDLCLQGHQLLRNSHQADGPPRRLTSKHLLGSIMHAMPRVAGLLAAC